MCEKNNVAVSILVVKSIKHLQQMNFLMDGLSHANIMDFIIMATNMTRPLK